MPGIHRLLISTALLLIALMPGTAAAVTIHVAVASNFATPLQDVATRFEAGNRHRVVLIRGSTGKHVAQIQNGAPYDAFFAADQRSVDHLLGAGRGIIGSSFTYATGKLIAWSPGHSAPRPDEWRLKSTEYRHVAIANPRLAPYGRAAKQVLQKLGIWQKMQGRLVRGENIGQTFQFVISGNAPVGFIAFSQVKRPGKPVTGSWWDIPEDYYSPINQQALLLTETPAAREFIEFCQSEEALQIIQDYGYRTADANI